MLRFPPLRFIPLLLTVAQFTVAGSVGVAGEPAYSTEQIAEGVYLFRSAGQRSLFLVGDTGIIVTDPLGVDAATEYLAAIRQITDLPIQYVVYSHYHWDRVAGGALFKEQGATFIAQERCAERFRVNPNAAVVMPDITFVDQLAVSVGGNTLEAYYFGPAHGDCLTVFLAEPAGLMQVVDMINPPRAAFPDNPNVPFVKPHNLRQFFQRVEALASERGVSAIIASRAGPEASIPATGPVTLIRDQASFWDKIFATVAEAKEQGNVGFDSFVRMKAINLELYEEYDGYEPTDLPIIMRRFVGAYDMGR